MLEISYNELRIILILRKESVMIYSKKRELVLDYVRSSCAHPTADEVYSGLRAQNEDVSLATVYRNLNQLADNGQLKRVTMPSAPDRFDGNIAPHIHAVCTCCGRTADIPEEAISDLRSIAGAHTGMEITGMTLVFHGICSACSANNKQE